MSALDDAAAMFSAADRLRTLAQVVTDQRDEIITTREAMVAREYECEIHRGPGWVRYEDSDTGWIRWETR